MRPGYKHTDVGVIPEDWKVRTFKELFNFSGGYSASRDQLSSEGHLYLHYGDIHGTTKTTIDVRADYQSIPKLNISLKRVAAKSLLEDGDVVFVDASEDDEGTSRHVVVVNKEKKPFISGLHTIVGKSKTDELVHEYRRYCFQTAMIRHQFLFYAVGTKVSGISKANIARLKLPIPTLPEQRAIAETLSDVDGLLSGLDRLIAKKRDLKRAVTQQLLTGQTRLPEYSGEWTTTSLSSVTTRLSGYWGTDKADSSHTKRVSVVRAGDISVDGQLEATATRYFSGSEFGKSEVKQGDVLLTGSGSVGKVWWCAGAQDLAASNFVRILRPVITQIDGQFLYQLLLSNSVQQIIKSHITVGVLANLGISFFNSEWLKLPSLSEQRAIATVLFDMDSEIATLEARRDKTRSLKRGIMQELLTGRIRLVQPEVLHA